MKQTYNFTSKSGFLVVFHFASLSSCISLVLSEFVSANGFAIKELSMVKDALISRMMDSTYA